MTASHDPVVAQKRLEIAQAAVAQYRSPADSMHMIGVTGTNGKTTTVDILRALLDEPGKPSASIGTLGVLRGRRGDPVPGGLGLTTPGPMELQRVLRDLLDSDVHTVAMEVSSHALDQGRVYGVTFDAAVFTNLTRDHLDYHGTMEAYRDAKARLITHLRPDGVAVVNAEEPMWAALPPAPRVMTFGHNGDVCSTGITFNPGGSEWTLSCGGDSARVTLPLIGDFNVANALAAAATAIALGHSVSDVAQRLSLTPQIPGRLEVIASVPTVLRDYAHTPDALERALAAVRPFVKGKLIVVFGAGGDRDPGKRPLMGRAAERGADVVIVTTDNPRTESPDAIIDDIERGMSSGHERIVDRRAAIERAVNLARTGDLVLLAGKGHEDYQVIGTEKHSFDERAIVAEITGGMS